MRIKQCVEGKKIWIWLSMTIVLITVVENMETWQMESEKKKEELKERDIRKVHSTIK